MLPPISDAHHPLKRYLSLPFPQNSTNHYHHGSLFCVFRPLSRKHLQDHRGNHNRQSTVVSAYNIFLVSFAFDSFSSQICQMICQKCRHIFSAREQIFSWYLSTTTFPYFHHTVLHNNNNSELISARTAPSPSRAPVADADPPRRRSATRQRVPRVQEGYALRENGWEWWAFWVESSRIYEVKLFFRSDGLDFRKISRKVHCLSFDRSCCAQ